MHNDNPFEQQAVLNSVGADMIRQLFNQYGLDPLNVAFKENKKGDGLSVVVHLADGQFHLSYHYFMQDALENLYGRPIRITECWDDGDYEVFDVAFWELKTMDPEGGLIMPDKGKPLAELVNLFNRNKLAKGVFAGIDQGWNFGKEDRWKH